VYNLNFTPTTFGGKVKLKLHLAECHCSREHNRTPFKKCCVLLCPSVKEIGRRMALNIIAGRKERQQLSLLPERWIQKDQ
jgi:hypothetical protein